MKRNHRLFWIVLPVLGCALITGIGLVRPDLFPTPTARPASSIPAADSLKRSLERELLRLPAIRSIDEFALFDPAGSSTVVLELQVDPGFATIATADQVLSLFSSRLTTFTFFSAILSDGSTAIDFTFNFRTDTWTQTRIP